ncbi:LysR family transcriptional regulator [Psychrobium sp. MM17-31]|uniref:LysR family transcriptional regulator n=1 Tax=Psychrobium sp. MM17-31 TaxID=2917758 RepID=UPI001EF61F7D|nr:LysR family transcriptional regulator [Psychrobium sp. MM17-31]MCG7532141.1 LysR family transcriptional regulator [Psychrobium sp. MM17-31]
MDKIESMRIFVKSADTLSFVEASRQLNLSPPAVTRAIALLEHTLGAKLFIRTTRHVRLTDVGRRFYHDSKRIIDDIDQAEAQARGVHQSPQGKLSVTAPVLFGQQHIMPIVTDYLTQYPQVDVDTHFYDRNSHLLEEGLDVAIRIGHLQDSSMYAVNVGHVKRITCASHHYLSHNGIPQEPQDLINHEIIQASTVESSATWHYGDNQQVKVTPRLRCNQNSAALSATLAGFGITRLMSYQVGEHIAHDRLVPVLEAFDNDELPVNVVYLEGRHNNSKVRSFVELAVEKLRENPYIHA